MVKLTEEMIVARTRVSDLRNVMKLNCWGAELDDISLVRHLCNVVVISLSVNCISRLSDIQFCRNLQELYIRKNKIENIAEIVWLKELPKLTNLWLEENPLCQSLSPRLYRLTVIRNLPRLLKLDDIDVNSDELNDSKLYGAELVYPSDRVIDPDQNKVFSTPSRRVSNQAFDVQPSIPLNRNLAQFESDNGNVEGSSADRRISRQSTSHHYHSVNCKDSPMIEQRFSSLDNSQSKLPIADVTENRTAFTSLDFSSSYSSSGGEQSAQLRNSMNLLKSREAGSGRQKSSGNVVSAVTCLIEELNLGDLQVVEQAIRNRYQRLVNMSD